MTCSRNQHDWAIHIDSHIETTRRHILGVGEEATHFIVIKNFGPLGGEIKVTAKCPTNGHLAYRGLGTKWVERFSIPGNDLRQADPPTVPLDWVIENGYLSAAGFKRVRVILEVSGPEQRSERIGPLDLQVDCRD